MNVRSNFPPPLAPLVPLTISFRYRSAPCVVLILRPAIASDVRYHERDPIRPERAVDKCERSCVCAIRAVDSSDLIATNGKLVRMSLAPVSSPSATILVSVLSRSSPSQPQQPKCSPRFTVLAQTEPA